MAKDKSSLYLPGKRSPAWQKIKRVRESEFVVGGYSFGGIRKEIFSGLLLGLYDDRQRLVYTEQLQQVMSEDNDSQKQRTGSARDERGLQSSCQVPA